MPSINAASPRGPAESANHSAADALAKLEEVLPSMLLDGKFDDEEERLVFGLAQQLGSYGKAILKTFQPSWFEASVRNRRAQEIYLQGDEPGPLPTITVDAANDPRLKSIPAPSADELSRAKAWMDKMTPEIEALKKATAPGGTPEPYYQVDPAGPPMPPARHFNGPLIEDGVSPFDAYQGGQDCWIVSTLASIAAARPDLLLQKMHDNKDGTYTFDFATGSVTVDSDLLMRDFGKPVDVSGAPIPGRPDQMELWPALWEKAYFASLGHYEGHGGLEADFMKAILGTAVSQPVDQNLATVIQDALANHWPITIGTYPAPDFIKGGPNRAVQAGLRDAHAYAIIGARQDPKQGLMVELRDPMDTNLAARPTHWVTIDTLLHGCNEVSISKVEQKG